MSQPKETLYNIGQGFAELEDYLISIGGEVSDEEVENEITQVFSKLQMSREEKLDNYGMLISSIKARAKARRDESARLAELAKSDESAVSRLQKNLRFIFEKFGWNKVPTTRFNFNLQNAGGNLSIKLKQEFENNPELLPERFRKMRYEIDTESIRTALKNGESLEFAELAERGKFVRIS